MEFLGRLEERQGPKSKGLAKPASYSQSQKEADSILILPQVTSEIYKILYDALKRY
jgi:hypothetical protein